MLLFVWLHRQQLVAKSCLDCCRHALFGGNFRFQLISCTYFLLQRAHPQHKASLQPSPDGLGAVTPKWAPLQTLTGPVRGSEWPGEPL